MVGTAIHVARGLLPQSIVDAALNLDFHFVLPLAPAAGLLLVDAGIHGKKESSLGQVSNIDVVILV